MAGVPAPAARWRTRQRTPSRHHSLLVTGRTHAYDGPQISVNNKMYNGSVYTRQRLGQVGANRHCSRHAEGEPSNDALGDHQYHTVVGNTAVPLGSWVQLTMPKYAMANAYDPGQAFLYVESGSGTQDFYIDDFTLTFIPPVQIEQNIPRFSRHLLIIFRSGQRLMRSISQGPTRSC